MLFRSQAADAEIRLSVLKANPARRVYERLGFTVVAEKAHAFEMVRARNASIEREVQGLSPSAAPHVER